MLWLVVSLVFVIFLIMGMEVSLTLFAVLGLFSSYWVALSNFHIMVFSLSLLCFVMLSLRSLFFSIRDRTGAYTEGRGSEEELGRVLGGEIIIMIYCMGKTSVFNERKKLQSILVPSSLDIG